MTSTHSNYPPDYETIKHLTDDFLDEAEEVDEYDESDLLEDLVSTGPSAEDLSILEEVPLFDEDE